jgi:hypothetical protein
MWHRAMDYSDAVRSPVDETPALSWSIFLMIASFSALAVYCTSLSLHTIDLGTGSVAVTESLKGYHEALMGLRDFPYQWRLLGIYLVYVGEKFTGFDPHTVDVVVKTALLCLSSMTLFLFSRLSTTRIGALCAVAVYHLLTVVGFADQYLIYFTNDYVMIACWFGAVYLVRTERYMEAAALAFVGAWAKETMVLVPILMGLRLLHGRGRVTVVSVIAAAAAFLVPTAVLRQVYRAPVSDWAWWHMLFANVPFLQSSARNLAMTLKNNFKVALFFNVLWVLAARAAIRTSDPFTKDLAMTGLVYLALAYPVIAIRELRHFLPLAIVVLPLAIAEIERHGAAAPPQQRPMPRRARPPRTQT